MNYINHYTTLIDRAKGRSLEGYVERHHIVPKCLGGSNRRENLVSLTAREHYVAHQLLVKMHPDNLSLVRAANMMTVGKNGSRCNNRKYEWLKVKNGEAVRIWAKKMWDVPGYREKKAIYLADPQFVEKIQKARAEYWADPENRKRQGDAAKRSNSTRWSGRVKPEKVVRLRGPQSPEARKLISEAKRKWWADKKANGEYEKTCSNISTGTKIAMQDPTVRNNHITAISAYHSQGR